MDFNAVAACIALSAVATALLVLALLPDGPKCECPFCRWMRAHE